VGLLGGPNSYVYVSSDPESKVDPLGTIEWEGTIITGGGGRIVGGAFFDMKFLSACVENKRAEVDMFAWGIGVGIGFKGANTTISSTFEDFDVQVDPRNLEGTFRMIGAGASVSVPPFPVGGPGVGVSYGFMQVGGAFSPPGWSVTLGADLSALAIQGRAWIVGEPKYEYCPCANSE
jgi:hypothetical protein